MVGHGDDTRAGRAVRRSFVAAKTALVGALLLAVACGGERELGDYPASTCDLGARPSGDPHEEQINIATFWYDDDREREAFRVLTRRVDDDNYYVSIDDMPDRVATQRHIRDAFENEKLPHLFQVNGGSDVVGWVDGRHGDERDLCALDSLREPSAWSDYFQETLEPIRCAGSIYALPVGVHHINVLFYNHALFEQLSALAEDSGITLTPPAALESPAELVELLRAVSELDTARLGGGAPIVPLAIGSSNDWPLTVVAYENVLLGLGRDAYETLWEGGLETDGGRGAQRLERSLREMLDVLRDLVRYSNYAAGIKWQDALRQVGSGQALLTITGDWGYAQLDPAQLPDVTTIAFPGTRGSFVYTPDSFAAPRELGANGFQARAFLDSAQDKAALIAFSNAKYSIPPRVDLEAEELAELTTRATYDEFSACARREGDCELLLAVSGLGPSPGIDPCLDEVEHVLALAVAGKPLTHERSCAAPEPRTAAAAEERLLEVWLEVAKRRFAASCR